MAKSRVTPQTFVLNERHELSPNEKSGGGGLARYNFEGIDWANKSTKLKTSLDKVAKKIQDSEDPLREQRYFFLAAPEETVEKLSNDEKKAPDGTFEEPTDYAATHSRVFSRLGLDLIEVTPDGGAVVHASPEVFDQVTSRANDLDNLGVREKSRWATVESFDVIPVQLRVDSSWLGSIESDELADVIVELQPVLTRLEVETVMRSVSDLLAGQSKEERLTGTGVDYSGRHWLRGRLSRAALKKIAKDYFSVQSLHSPLYSVAAAAKKRTSKPKKTSKKKAAATAPAGQLPCVAVFDSGIPAGHEFLGAYRRGQFTAPAVTGGPGEHGSRVASRVVYGEQDFSGGMANIENLQADCRFLDVNVSGGFGSIHDKSVFDGLAGVVGAYPDVRVYNFSFAAEKPLANCNDIDRRERMLMVQDLDNFIFANDVIVVVAAGNSVKGVLPTQPYPMHIDDPNWQLGHWAMGYNSMVCGATVGGLSSNGVVKSIGWPSPVTRIGPGICDAPIPGFAATGGNCDENYQFSAGLGVWVCSDKGAWEDHSGTSYAAPILAREAAFAFQRLQQFCSNDTQPFAVTVKAFLALTAQRDIPPDTPRPVLDLCERAIGRGYASSDRLRTPQSSTGVYLWQGVLEGTSDEVNVQIPIPHAWYSEAEKPVLRIVAAADVPVNEAVTGLYASRKLSLTLRAAPESRALNAQRRRSTSHRSYPLVEKVYDLLKTPKGVEIKGDMWLISMKYEDIADYHPNIDFDSHQRVAFAAELIDESDTPQSPQSAIQSLPIASTMTRFSVPAAPVRSPVILRSRLS